MKRDFLFLLVLLILVLSSSALANCPQDSLDRGVCDTMTIQPWPADTADTVWSRPGPYYVRVPVYVTADVVNSLDSIASFVIPLCYTSNKPSKYCSVSTYMNRILWTGSNLDRSIFRHMPSNQDPQIHNWMMDLFDAGNGEEWNFINLDLDGTSHFWLSLIPTGTEDPRFGTGAHTLLFTITFKLQDSMGVCIDTCYQPPDNHLAFATIKDDSTTGSKIPRSGTGTESFKVCFLVVSDVRETGGDVIKPTDFSLSQNYPNPFNPTTNFQFTLPKSSHVKIEVFNIVGQKVATVVDGDMKPGEYTADWNGKDESGKTVSSGIYFYRMQAGDFSNMKKMVLIK
jgi:hypothetical protein